jgi:hypothetical protein
MEFRAAADPTVRHASVRCSVRLARWRIQFNPGIAAWLLDYLIRSRQHIRRNGQADLLCGFQVDDELELHGLLHRQVGGLGAFL